MSSGQISRDGAFLLSYTFLIIPFFLSSSGISSERNEEETRKRSDGTRD